MTANSVEKHYFVRLHAKLQEKIKLKTFYWFLELLYTTFAFNRTNQLGLSCAKV